MCHITTQNENIGRVNEEISCNWSEIVRPTKKKTIIGWFESSSTWIKTSHVESPKWWKATNIEHLVYVWLSRSDNIDMKIDCLLSTKMYAEYVYNCNETNILVISTTKHRICHTMIELLVINLHRDIKLVDYFESVLHKFWYSLLFVIVSKTYFRMGGISKL